MEASDVFKDRLVDLQKLVDEERSEPEELKTNVSAFGQAELGQVLRPFQVEAASYLLNGSRGNVLALIRPPGDGKSLTYITVGCRSRGITVVFQPTLTLGADQCSKLKSLREKLRLLAFNLDDYKTKGDWDPVVKQLQGLKDLPPRAIPRVFLIASPQCVTDKDRPWKSLILELAGSKLIRQIVVDEFHLWWKQGLTFRTEFNKAGNKIISEVTKKSPFTSVVLLTATSRLIDVALVESICGVLVTRIIWAAPREMQKRGVQIDMTCRSSFTNVAKKIVGPVMADGEKKFIVFTEFRGEVDTTAQSMREIASTIDNCTLDCLEIHGQLSSEQKGFNIDLFCENVTEPEEKKLVELYRGLVATSGSASTGIDPPNVALVARKGLPPSASTMFQEAGRLQRGDADSANKYLYHITISVDSYALLLGRAEGSDTATREEKNRNLADHFEVMKMLVLDNVCLHFALEQAFGRPRSSDTLEESCDGMCPICSGSRLAECVPFYVKPLQRSLASVFLESATMNLKDKFVSKLKEISLEEGVWGHANNATGVRTTIDTHNVEMLTLQLIAARIIEPTFGVSKGAGEDGKDEVIVLVRGIRNEDRTGYRFSEQVAFDCIPKARQIVPATLPTPPSDN